MYKVYKNRTQNLLELSFYSYQEYLDSDLWNEIRQRVLKFANYKCRCCGKKAECVHHSSYSIAVLKGKNLKKLIALCNDCHKNGEFEKDNSKTKSIARVNRKIYKYIVCNNCGKKGKENKYRKLSNGNCCLECYQSELELFNEFRQIIKPDGEYLEIYY